VDVGEGVEVERRVVLGGLHEDIGSLEGTLVKYIADLEVMVRVHVDWVRYLCG
jgi:hypothetical protein